MGMSTHCVGFRPTDEQWEGMKTIWDTCEALNIPIPQEVDAFFDGEPPGDKPGQHVSLGDAATEYQGTDANGYEIDVAKLPPGITIVRVYNSW